jgi:hypothetical protein
MEVKYIFSKFSPYSERTAAAQTPLSLSSFLRKAIFFLRSRHHITHTFQDSDAREEKK